MDQATAVFPLCRHIKRDGARCASPALTGMNFCFHHIGGRISHVRAASNYSPKLNVLPASTREAIQHNLSEIALAFSDGKIDIRMTNTYLRVYRTAEQNLTRWEKSNKDNEGKPMLPLNEAAFNDVSSTATSGAPFKRSLSGEEANTTTDLVIPTGVSAANAAEGPALHDASTTATSGAPFKRSLSGEEANTTADLVIPSETSGAPFKRSLSGEETNTTTDLVIPSEVEGPAFHDASTTAIEDDDDEYDALKDKTLREGMTYKYPSVEYTYELRDRIHQRHQEHAAKKRARELAKAQVAS